MAEYRLTLGLEINLEHTWVEELKAELVGAYLVGSYRSGAVLLSIEKVIEEWFVIHAFTDSKPKPPD